MIGYDVFAQYEGARGRSTSPMARVALYSIVGSQAMQKIGLYHLQHSVQLFSKTGRFDEDRVQMELLARIYLYEHMLKRLLCTYT